MPEPGLAFQVIETRKARALGFDDAGNIPANIPAIYVKKITIYSGVIP